MEKETNEEMMKRVAEGQKPTRDQLQANIQISHNWKTAVSSGEYRGHACLHIATLLDFLEKEHAKAVETYEREALTHPEWGAQGLTPPAGFQPCCHAKAPAHTEACPAVVKAVAA